MVDVDASVQVLENNAAVVYIMAFLATADAWLAALVAS